MPLYYDADILDEARITAKPLCGADAHVADMPFLTDLPNPETTARFEPWIEFIAYDTWPNAKVFHGVHDLVQQIESVDFGAWRQELEDSLERGAKSNLQKV